MSYTVTQSTFTSTILSSIWSWQNSSCSCRNQFICWATLTSSTIGALNWMKQLFIKYTTCVKDGCSLSNEHYPIVQGILNVIWAKQCSQNLFPSACLCWDFRFSLLEMNQKLKFDGTIGYGDSYLEFILRHFKVCRLHSILNDAAGAVRAHSCRLLLHDWRRNKFMFAWPHDWATFSILRKTLSTFHFQLCRLLKQYVLHCFRYGVCR